MDSDPVYSHDVCPSPIDAFQVANADLTCFSGIPTHPSAARKQGENIIQKKKPLCLRANIQLPRITCVILLPSIPLEFAKFTMNRDLPIRAFRPAMSASNKR